MENKSRGKICIVVAVDITLRFLLVSEVRFFKKNGYDVFVVCSPGKWLDVIRKEGVTVKEIVIKRNIFTPVSDLISLINMFLYFRQEKFDMVMTFTPKPGLLGQVAAKFAGVPIIINTIFGYYFHENMAPIKRSFFILIEKIAAKCSSLIFFRNKEDFETAKKENIGSNAVKKYVGDGIDIEKFKREKFPLDFVANKKKSLGINPHAKVVGIVARLVREKGYTELFEAFKGVVLQFPEAILLVVGPADLQKKDYIDASKIKQKNIIFLGERTDMDELYAVMDMFVLPSYREGFPHSVMEASAMSLPVITTNVRGCRNAIEPNVTGILIPPKTITPLMQAMIELLEDQKKAKEMGGYGQEKAEKEFDKNILLQKMNTFIDAIIIEKIKKS